MKVILVGYPGSQKIRKVSEYLTSKYLPGFDVIYLNYEGEISGWARYLFDYFIQLEDAGIIFALDDYLVASPIGELPKLGDAICAKLCVASDEENEEYPITTQYTFWSRIELLKLLSQVTTPWEFEIKGSQIAKEKGCKVLFTPILNYYTNSSLSKRWEGVDLTGLNEEDVIKVQELL